MTSTSNRLPRTVLASLSAAVLLVGLAACTPSEPSPSPSPSTPAAGVDVCATPSGDAVESVSVSGEFLQVPTVEFEAGLSTDSTQRLVTGSGDGARVDDGEYVSVAYAMYRGSTGEKIEDHGFGETGPVLLHASVGSMMPGLLKTLGCAEGGTRIVSAIAPSDAFGEEGFSDPSGEFDGLEIAPNETLVVVMDLVRVLDRAWGEEQPEVDGMPRVTLIAEGQPVVTIPDAEPPTELQIAVLKRGDGPPVQLDSVALVQYLGVKWDTNETFDSSWARGQVAEFPLSGLIPGFQEAVKGQPLGSQILVVIPPELGYGSKTGAADDHALAGETLVFVIDLLYAVTPR